MVASSDRTAGKFSLSPGNAHDAPEGRKLLRRLGNRLAGVTLLMDRAYEGDKNREQAVEMGMNPIVTPPWKKSRKAPWQSNQELYKKHHQAERLFWRWKGDRLMFSRFAKRDGIFTKFVMFTIT